ncbi:MAG: amidohydrolase family protein [Elusimicrobia bacterium]|nr:amidohydrolase family protein [Elusimicrobiota bacterium]
MTGLTDVHVHLAALPTKSNGCLVSKKTLNGPLGRFIAWKLGLPVDKPEEANRIYLDKLDAELGRSTFVTKSVLLGMDGVYDSGGRLDEARTHFLMSNDAVLQAVKTRPRLLAGVSINPARRDALDELERCAEAGAALVKVLPNAQVFDPADKRFVPFYRALAKHKIPLLSHTGYEFSLMGQDQSVGDPARLVVPLEEGATVIAAHACSYGIYLYEPFFPTFLHLVEKYKNFYVDASALTLPNRAGAMLKIRKHPELFERILFGTDYPLPVFSFPCLGIAAVGSWLRARSADNRFDRQWRVLEAMGIPVLQDLSKVSPRLAGNQ